MDDTSQSRTAVSSSSSASFLPVTAKARNACKNKCSYEPQSAFLVLSPLLYPDTVISEISIIPCSAVGSVYSFCLLNSNSSSCSCVSIFDEEDGRKCLLLCECVVLKLYAYCSKTIKTLPTAEDELRASVSCGLENASSSSSIKPEPLQEAKGAPLSPFKRPAASSSRSMQTLEIATRLLLLVNPSHDFSWKHRQSVLRQHKQCAMSELNFLNLLLKLHPKSGECWSYRRAVMTIILAEARLSACATKGKEVQEGSSSTSGETKAEVGNKRSRRSEWLWGSSALEFIFLQELDYIEGQMVSRPFHYFAVNYIVWLKKHVGEIVLNKESDTLCELFGPNEGYTTKEAKLCQGRNERCPEASADKGLKVLNSAQQWNAYCLNVAKRFIGLEPSHYGPYELFIQLCTSDIEHRIAANFGGGGLNRCDGAAHMPCAMTSKISTPPTTRAAIDISKDAFISTINFLVEQTQSNMDYSYSLLDLFPTFDAAWTFRMNLVSLFVHFATVILTLMFGHATPSTRGISFSSSPCGITKSSFVCDLAESDSHCLFACFAIVVNYVFELIRGEICTMSQWRRYCHGGPASMASPSPVVALASSFPSTCVSPCPLQLSNINFQDVPLNLGGQKFFSAALACRTSVSDTSLFARLTCQHEARCYDEIVLFLLFLKDLVKQSAATTESEMRVLPDEKKSIDKEASWSGESVQCGFDRCRDYCKKVVYVEDLIRCWEEDDSMVDYEQHHPYARKTIRQIKEMIAKDSFL